MKKRIILLVTGLVLLISSGASAKGFGPDGKKGRFFDDLKLTSQQEENLSKVRVEKKKKMIAARSKMMIAKIELGEILKVKNFSTGNAKSQINKIIAIKSEIEMIKLNAMDQTRKILSADQWKLFSKRFGHKGPHRRGIKKGQMRYQTPPFAMGPDMSFRK